MYIVAVLKFVYYNGWKPMPKLVLMEFEYVLLTTPPTFGPIRR